MCEVIFNGELPTISSPNTFIWIAFILYLISSLVFLSQFSWVYVMCLLKKESLLPLFKYRFNTYVDYLLIASSLNKELESDY